MITCRECNEDIDYGELVIHDLCYDCYYHFLIVSGTLKETLKETYEQMLEYESDLEYQMNEVIGPLQFKIEELEEEITSLSKTHTKLIDNSAKEILSLQEELKEKG